MATRAEIMQKQTVGKYNSELTLHKSVACQEAAGQNGLEKEKSSSDNRNNRKPEHTEGVLVFRVQWVWEFWFTDLLHIIFEVRDCLKNEEK